MTVVNGNDSNGPSIPPTFHWSFCICIAFNFLLFLLYCHGICYRIWSIRRFDTNQTVACVGCALFRTTWYIYIHIYKIHAQILKSEMAIDLPGSHLPTLKVIVCTWKLRYIINYLSPVHALVKKFRLYSAFTVFHTPSFSFFAMFENILVCFFPLRCCCCYFYVHIGCLHLRFSFMLGRWLGWNSLYSTILSSISTTLFPFFFIIAILPSLPSLTIVINILLARAACALRWAWQICEGTRCTNTRVYVSQKNVKCTDL